MARALKERYIDTTATSSDAPRPVQLYDTPQPRSKLSIGRLSYTVPKLPKLLVLNFKVECESLSSPEDSDSEESVWGRLESRNKLRRLAVAEYLAAKDQP
ncbi:hypothetical protein E8E11_001417 [Didymella keratinophila]|nr:hypothetical protein E8E11_001417 [Didymella keratinophila]